MGKVKESPTSAGTGSMRNGVEETLPLCSFSCNDDVRGDDWGTHGQGEHFPRRVYM